MSFKNDLSLIIGPALHRLSWMNLDDMFVFVVFFCMLVNQEHLPKKDHFLADSIMVNHLKHLKQISVDSIKSG